MPVAHDSISTRRLAPALVLLAVALCGCGTTNPQSGARSFLAEHRVQAEQIQSAVRAGEAAAAQLPASPSALQLRALGRLARAERGRVQAAHDEWINATGAEEEELPHTESEIDEGANELRNAMAALATYASAPSPAALQRYRGELASGREQWNEGISHLFYLADQHGAPTV